MGHSCHILGQNAISQDVQDYLTRKCLPQSTGLYFQPFLIPQVKPESSVGWRLRSGDLLTWGPVCGTVSGRLVILIEQGSGFREMGITGFVRNLIWLLPPTPTCDPFANLEAHISFMLHVHVGLFEEKDPNHNSESKYDRTNKIR